MLLVVRLCVKVYGQPISKRGDFDLFHTELDLSFDFENRSVIGKEWITLKPAYDSSILVCLDAKAMVINNIKLLENQIFKKVNYQYNGYFVNIKLEHFYREKITIYIDYIAKPENVPGRIEDQGLFFINPQKKQKNKPTQIWTQGQPERSSAWFPTIDKPSQKTTQDIRITIPNKYTTLSNGILYRSKNHTNGLRTDFWKMDKPHSPYLFMIAIGEFVVYKDTWRNKEVSYYVEPAFERSAKLIFGITPNALNFFSNKFNYEYPWIKYAQIAVRDYGNGAMENTTASLFGDYIQVSNREYLDWYEDDKNIIHELSHQWFGNLVTPKDWANIALSESFAEFCEIIWREYKYGPYSADALYIEKLEKYLNQKESSQKALIRNNFERIEEVFDAVTYQKGGCILTMLRNILGDSLFSAGINHYLIVNAYKCVDVSSLKSSLEKISGQNLDLFFEQWFFKGGHPILDIQYKWDENNSKQFIYVHQQQNSFNYTLDLNTDFYFGSDRKSYMIHISKLKDTFSFEFEKQPRLISLISDNKLVAEILDHKSPEQFQIQYKLSDFLSDKYQSLQAVEELTEEVGKRIILYGLQDNYYKLRLKALSILKAKEYKDDAIVSQVLKMVKNDSNNIVKAIAITILDKYNNKGEYDKIFLKALHNKSYKVASAALEAIWHKDSVRVLKISRRNQRNAKAELKRTIIKVYCEHGNANDWPFVYEQFLEKPDFIPAFVKFINRVKKPEYASQGIVAIKEFVMRYKLSKLVPSIISMFTEVKQNRILLRDRKCTTIIDQCIVELSNFNQTHSEN